MKLVCKIFARAAAAVAGLVLFLASECPGAVAYGYDSLNRLTNVDYGNGSVIAYTYDAAGNRLTYSGTVSNDTTPPSVAIFNPTSGSTFATSSSIINLSGTSSDNIGVTLVTWANDRGGIGTAAGTTSWNIGTIPLQAGENAISVTAYDGAGNSTTATLTITLSAPIIGLSGELGFGNVPVGEASTLILVITNSGGLALNVGGISYPPGFSGAWSGTVAAGGSQQVPVTFAPTTTQAYGGTITVNCDSNGGTNSISCSGTGVNEVNVAPVLPVIATQTVNELALLTVTNTATESNIHSTLGYALLNPPAGMAIDTNGIITWTPQQNQSPSTNLVTTLVTNANPYDPVNPHLSATNAFTVIVKEVSLPQLEIVLVGGQPQLTWSAVPGWRYQVWVTGALANTPWTNVGGVLTASGDTLEFTDSATSGTNARFYRVQALGPP